MAGLARMAGVVLVVLVALSGGRALAGEEDPCQGIDRHWRIAGHDRAHTTSACVGDPKSPLCALDTYMAGWVREDFALGQRVAPDSLIDPDDGPKEYTKYVAPYRVTGCRVMTEHDRPTEAWGMIRPSLAIDRDHTWSPGDIGLDVLDTMCDRDLKDCRRAEKKKDITTLFIARQVDAGHWRLVDWKLGDVLPVQRHHVGPPCRPEDGTWQTITGDGKTTTSPCHCTTATPLCAYETDVLSGMGYGHFGQYFRYKVLDCETLGTEGQDPDHWDPRPRYWQPGDVRIGVLVQRCDEQSSICKHINELLLIQRKQDITWYSLDSESSPYSGGAE
jgi:hypothetical protein